MAAEEARRHRDEIVQRAGEIERSLGRGRALAEELRVEAERLRDASEAERRQGESKRVRAELGRVTSEASRQLREDTRQQSETVRRASERERQDRSTETRTDELDPALRRAIRDEVRSALELLRSVAGAEGEQTRT